MQAHLIFWPMLTVLAIPLFVLILNAKRKAADRKAGTYNADAAIINTAWSLPVVLTSNSLANQFQLPVIFYVLCFIIFNINAVSHLVIFLAWAFALLRWIHAIVHVTTNTISLRFASFLPGVLVLFAIFIYTLVTMAKLS